MAFQHRGELLAPRPLPVEMESSSDYLFPNVNPGTDSHESVDKIRKPLLLALCQRLFRV